MHYLCRLRSTLTLSSPFTAAFVKQFQEVFHVILQGIIEQDDLGHKCTSNDSVITVLRTDRRKAVYIMTRMDKSCIADENQHLWKNYVAKGVAKVLFQKKSPLLSSTA